MEKKIWHMRSKFKIVGPPDPDSDDMLYWSVTLNGWVINKDATTFGDSILRHPLPPGTVGILEYSKNGPMKFHSFHDWGGV